MIERILSPELIHALGWTLVHSLWQAAVFAIGLGLTLIALRRFSARARYNVAIASLMTFFLTVVLTFAGQYQSAEPAFTAQVLPVEAKLPTPPAISLNTDNVSVDPALTQASAPDRVGESSLTFRERVVTYYNNHLPLIVTFWLMGVLILQLRFLGQLTYLQRLKNYGAERFPTHLAPLLQELETALDIRKPVRYLSSFRVGSPFTSGWWRPVVFFPATLLAELNEPELRTIIAHELAHVKRHDFLVNLVQTLVCILFFYHPAVWWMSARIEDEREHCCDDLAIAVTGERVGYARTLVRLKEREAAPGMAMGLLGKSNGFKQRVTRLLSGYLGTGTYGEGFTSAVIIAVIMSLAVTLSAQQQQSVPEATHDAPEDTLIPFEQLTEEEARTNPMARPERSARPERPVRPAAPVAPVRTAADVLSADLPDSTAFRFFLEAIDDGNEELTRYFIGQGVDVNGVDKDGWTPLMVAAGEHQPEMVRLLLAAGAQVNYINFQGVTALIEAADEGSTDCARLLLEAGATVDLPGTRRSALSMAASEGHAEMITLLIAAGANTGSLQGGVLPLHEAAEEGRLEIVKALLNKGADAGARDGDGRAELSYAAEEGQADVVAYLLVNGANPNDGDNHRRTALSYAAEEGQYTIVDLLLKAGATHTTRDDKGYAAIDYAVWELIRLGAKSVGYSGTKTYDAEEEMSWKDDGKGVDEVIRLLVRKGASSSFITVDASGRVLLSYAAIKRSGYDERRHGDHYGSYEHWDAYEVRPGTEAQEGYIGETGFSGEMDNTTGYHYDGGSGRDERSSRTSSANNDVSKRRVERLIAEGNLEQLTHLLRNGAPTETEDGCSVLFMATREREAATVRALLEAGFTTGSRCDFYDTDNHYLPSNGGTLALYESATPLMLAITQVDASSAKVLLDGGANPNAPCRKRRYTADRKINGERASETPIDEIDGLYNQVYNHSSWTPLFEAIEANDPVLVRLLLAAGADKDLRLAGRVTPLSFAESLGNEDIIALLR